MLRVARDRAIVVTCTRQVFELAFTLPVPARDRTGRVNAGGGPAVTDFTDCTARCRPMYLLPTHPRMHQCDTIRQQKPLGGSGLYVTPQRAAGSTAGSQNQPAQDDQAMSRDTHAASQARNARTYVPRKNDRTTHNSYIQPANIRPAILYVELLLTACLLCFHTQLCPQAPAKIAVRKHNR
jgi:hypothetical protein